MNALPKKILGHKILVEPIRQEEKKHGDIIIPSTVNQTNEQANVIMVAEGVVWVNVGDIVVYPKNAGIPQEYGGKQYKYLNGPTSNQAGDIIAII